MENETLRLPGADARQFRESARQFVDAVHGRGEVLATGEEGLQVTAVLRAILDSIKSGEPVRVEVP